MTLIFPVVIIIICLLTSAICYAQTSNTRITPEFDVYVSEHQPNINFDGKFRNYAGYVNGSIVSYIKFNLSSIPKPGLMKDIVIDSAELRLLVPATSTEDYDQFVSVSLCNNNTWKPDKITWNSPVCSNSTSLKGMDSIVVGRYSQPVVYGWDVLGGIVDAIANNTNDITLVITSFPLVGQNIGYELLPESSNIEGNVTFWSMEKSGFGFSAAPLLIISYTIKESSFATYLYFILSTVLPTLAIILPFILWLYRKIDKQR
jgi:hypothetical protein